MTPQEADSEQNWRGMDGAIAWHLIDRHADNWAEVGEMMNAWLRANCDEAVKAEREACRDACHEAIKRACAEAGVKEPTFVGMCLEVGLERFDDVLTANTK